MNIVPFDNNFIAKCAELRSAMAKRYTDISAITTPELDGSGQQIINTRPDGMQYIVEAYMRAKLTELFPGWSWEMAAPPQFVAYEWVTVSGHLIIIDEHLLAYGINPPYRKFYGIDSARIQFKKGLPHTPENLIDLGDNCQSASTSAFKRAINRLTGIGDDVYRKRIELEGAGTIDSIILSNTKDTIQRDMFNKFLKENHKLDSWAMKELNIKSYAEITDWRAAYEILKHRL